MSKKPSATDAQLIMQLYDLRREAEMRKARNWWLGYLAQQDRFEDPGAVLAIRLLLLTGAVSVHATGRALRLRQQAPKGGQ